jgi:hypothetical protein
MIRDFYPSIMQQQIIILKKLLNDLPEYLSDPLNETHIPKEPAFKERENTVDEISSSWCHVHCGLTILLASYSCMICRKLPGF